MKQPLFKLAVPILALPRVAKRLVALSVDLGLCVLTIWLAFYLRLGEIIAQGLAFAQKLGAEDHRLEISKKSRPENGRDF